MIQTHVGGQNLLTSDIIDQMLNAVKPFQRSLDERFIRLSHWLVILGDTVVAAREAENVRAPPHDGTICTARRNCSAFASLEIQDTWTSHGGLWSEGDCLRSLNEYLTIR